ncbi:hypothetical protein MKW98_000650 [Papaver atlanticum]|uniref:Uncharacterized protein n=1 Tax=Papaver atlanticum TaxID=357466 RepID=A0AAD4XR13_9MAGN|nr:hypothetical protein MKW98_000650 [Papaver atlanticum]
MSSSSAAATTLPEAQTTDPVEVKALNSIFQQWNISAGSLWNISGEPCSGAATDRTGIEANPNFNPGIKCSCGTTNRSTCHITQLRVYAMNIRGVILKELADLTFLTFLMAGQRSFIPPVCQYCKALQRFPKPYLRVH